MHLWNNYYNRSSLFGNALENKKITETKEENTAAPAAAKPSRSLFGNLSKTTLFGSTNPTSLFGAGTGLFANLSSASNGSGLSFLSGAKTDETKPTGGLFGSGLFGNNGTNAGLFSGLSKPAEGFSLFDKPIAGSGLFGIQSNS